MLVLEEDCVLRKRRRQVSLHNCGRIFASIKQIEAWNHSKPQGQSVIGFSLNIITKVWNIGVFIRSGNSHLCFQDLAVMLASL